MCAVPRLSCLPAATAAAMLLPRLEWLSCLGTPWMLGLACMVCVDSSVL